MNAEIIAIGTELTTGAKLDTNSQWLSLALGEIGIPVHFHATVADDLGQMINLFRAAVARSDIILITGGLGPTLDDLTRQALAGLMQTELVLHEPSLEFIKSLFARRNRAMPERNSIQAMFPEGSEPIRNPRGSAPGIWIEYERANRDRPCLIATMPGVPSEMKRMYQEEVLPRLPSSNRVIRRARVNCFGIGESNAEEMLGDLTARGREPEVGITVHEATITLRITAHGQTVEECAKQIDATKQIIHERMGNLVFGEEDQELEHVVVGMLADRGLTLATAECGTGGMLAHRLTEVDNFEDCYVGGLIAPSSKSKPRVVGIDSEIVSRGEAASKDVARQMAEECRRRFGADFGLAVTECPRFDPDDTESAAPTGYLALATSKAVQIKPHTLIGDPAITKSRATKALLDLLRRHLLKGETD